MGRKVFLSFLGTGGYKPCKYVSAELGESSVVYFVQEAIYQLACRDFTTKDKVFIFLTKDAEEKNWPGLFECLSKYTESLHPVTQLPEGYNESDVWKIFENVLNVLEEDDEIILDITHGFRSLPMLAMVLLNYAKALKNTIVKGIFYGAFEVLGPSYQIDTNIPDPNDRKAPLLNLLAFSILQDWTFAAQTFIKTGNPEGITQLTRQNLIPILIESKGKNETASLLRTVTNAIERGEREIATNRGKLISNGTNFLEAKNTLQEVIKNTAGVFAPLKPILFKIQEKIANFGHNANLNWESGVEWCILHGLEQQGITQLQEGIIGYVCQRNKLDVTNIQDRELVSQALNIYSRNIEQANWKKPAIEHPEIIMSIMEDIFVKDHRANFDKLVELRNDINHGGFKKNALQKSGQFSERLKEIFNTYRSIKQLVTNPS